MAREQGRIVLLVPPAHTTTDCALPHCLKGVGGPQRSESESQARPAAVGTHLYLHRLRNRVPRDRNSARVMLIRAGLSPAGADGVRPQRGRYGHGEGAARALVLGSVIHVPPSRAGRGVVESGNFEGRRP